MKTASFDFILRRLATVLSVVILTLSLIAALTGILLAFYYEPAAGGAYDSLQHIDSEVTNGWLIHGAHNIAGNAAIAVGLIQIVVMFVGRQFYPSWYAAWITNILFALCAIGLGWTAMILDWSELGYWRLNIELGIIEAIPFIGTQLRDIITGGGPIITATVEHLYAIHSYILSIGAITLAIVHLAALLLQERRMKLIRIAEEILAIDSESNQQQEKENSLILTGRESK